METTHLSLFILIKPASSAFPTKPLRTCQYHPYLYGQPADIRICIVCFSSVCRIVVDCIREIFDRLVSLYPFLSLYFADSYIHAVKYEYYAAGFLSDPLELCCCFCPLPHRANVVIRHVRPFRKCTFREESVQYVRNVDGQRSLNNSSDIVGTSAPPQEEWLFLPPTPGQPSTNPNTTPSSTYNSPPSGSTSSSASSPIVGLELDADDEPFTVYGVLAMFASEYLTTALGMPFEVGKTLLQVEYKPKPGVDDGVEVEGIDYEVETDDQDSVAGDQAEGSRRRRDSIEDSVRHVSLQQFRVSGGSRLTNMLSYILVRSETQRTPRPTFRMSCRPALGITSRRSMTMESRATRRDTCLIVSPRLCDSATLNTLADVDIRPSCSAALLSVAYRHVAFWIVWRLGHDETNQENALGRIARSLERTDPHDHALVALEQSPTPCSLWTYHLPTASYRDRPDGTQLGPGSALGIVSQSHDPAGSSRDGPSVDPHVPVALGTASNSTHRPAIIGPQIQVVHRLAKGCRLGRRRCRAFVHTSSIVDSGHLGTHAPAHLYTVHPVDHRTQVWSHPGHIARDLFHAGPLARPRLFARHSPDRDGQETITASRPHVRDRCMAARRKEGEAQIDRQTAQARIPRFVGYHLEDHV